MSSPSAVFRTSRLEQTASPRGRPIGAILLANGNLGAGDAVFALAEALRSGAALPRVLLAEDLASPGQVLDAQALHYGAMTLSSAQTPPDDNLVDAITPEACLKLSALPWMWIGETLVVATSRPETFDKVIDQLPGQAEHVAMALALESDIQGVIARRHGDAMARRAETQVPADESCRDMDSMSPAQALLGAGFGLGCLWMLYAHPSLFFGSATVLALVTLLFAQGLKLAALLAGWRRPRAPRGALLSRHMRFPLFPFWFRSFARNASPAA
ncbi:GspE/PulE/PilB domain-containing protein [Salipiger aestuarii]|uniref:Type II secretion system (T2SS) protein E n=1 Tax=Salipiger aestuarii TaxID=568098 RepID=A0A327YYI4_9RHOB|nr:hypothetical protein [Salipiger aestuarii]RAK22979.1 type II secretion system (T2SS) protein E [Salipiger aestuarii]